MTTEPLSGLELVGAFTIILMALAFVWVVVCVIDGYLRGEIGSRNEVRFPRRFGED